MKYNRIILFIIGLTLIAGCEKFPVGGDFLAKAPGVDVTKDSIFLKKEYAVRFLWGAYETLPYGINTSNDNWGNKMSHDLLESLTDLMHSYLNWGGPFTQYYPGLYNSATENGSNATKYSLTQERGFEGIRQALIFIENIGKTPDIDEAEKIRMKAEARMIIGIHYMEFFRHFGGMPWLSKPFSVTDDFTALPRLTAQATCDSIVALCDKAMPDLPWVQSNLAEDEGRFTRASAMGLKVRALHFNASPVFNDAAPYLDGAAAEAKLVWHGGYNANLWNRAADAAQALINQAESTGNYGIHKTSNPRKDFQDAYYKRGLEEVIISTRRMYRTPNAGWDYTFYWSSQGWGSTNPTQTYVDMFPMSNGLPITDPASGYNAATPFANRDPRLYETILVNGDAYKGRTAELYISGRERRTEGQTQARTGYIVRKFMLDGNNTTSYQSVTHWPWLRMAEVYLINAEALNEINNGPNTEAYRCVNIVRNRVGLPGLPAGLTKEQFREAVILERALEFGMEEVRWFDLIRWKREADFKKTLQGMNTRGTSVNGPFTYDRFDLPPRYWQSTWSPKWYFSAFPLNEINKGYGLIQNPGWE